MFMRFVGEMRGAQWRDRCRIGVRGSAILTGWGKHTIAKKNCSA